jgi:hypothetical protein
MPDGGASPIAASAAGTQPAGSDQPEQLGVAPGSHPVAAEHLQLARDDEVHRHGRPAEHGG